MRYLRDSWNIQHIKPRVAHCFTKKQFGVGSNRFFPSIDIVWMDKGGFNAKSAHRVVQQIMRATIQRTARNNM